MALGIFVRHYPMPAVARCAGIPVLSSHEPDSVSARMWLTR